jgi:hypothetical protein
MSHATYMQGNRVYSWLLVVGSQIANLTSGPSFGHNFQWYKELLNPFSIDPCNRPLKIRESTGIPSPKVEIALGVWGFIPSHFPTLPRACGVTPRLPLGSQPCKPLCLSREPKARVATNFILVAFFLELEVTFCKRYCTIQNDEQVYMALRIIKQGYNEKVDIIHNGSSNLQLYWT